MSSLDAKLRVAVLPLCDCSPEPHESLSSDRVALGKGCPGLLLHSLGWDTAVKTSPGAMEAPQAPAAPPWM